MVVTSYPRRKNSLRAARRILVLRSARARSVRGVWRYTMGPPGTAPVDKASIERYSILSRTLFYSSGSIPDRPAGCQAGNGGGDGRVGTGGAGGQPRAVARAGRSGSR